MHLEARKHRCEHQAELLLCPSAPSAAQCSQCSQCCWGRQLGQLHGSWPPLLQNQTSLGPGSCFPACSWLWGCWDSPGAISDRGSARDELTWALGGSGNALSAKARGRQAQTLCDSAFMLKSCPVTSPWVQAGDSCPAALDNRVQPGFLVSFAVPQCLGLAAFPSSLGAFLHFSFARFPSLGSPSLAPMALELQAEILPDGERCTWLRSRSWE